MAEKLAFNLEGLAESTGVSVPFLRKQIREGHLNPTHLGRRIVITRAEADRFLKQHTPAPGAVKETD